MSKRLLAVKELSKEYNLKESWIRLAILTRTIPFIKLRRVIRFDRGEIEKWLKDNKVT